MTTENILPDLNFPFVEEMKKFAVPFFPDKTEKNHKRIFWSLQMEFPDSEGLLQTAVESLHRFLAGGNCQEKKENTSYIVRIEKEEKSVFEEYSLEITPQMCRIAANDTEGIRRGIYEFIDLFCANGGVLPEKCEKIQRKPFLSIRIGRCPFSPIKRWPVNTDELLDDIDYYPDAYLETLAHDGINGIWLVSQLRELGVSSYTKEDPQREKRLEKLSRVAEKCGRYGIKVWLFMIEPFAVPDDDLLYKEHPELFMQKNSSGGKNCFCPASPDTQKYLYEITKSVFSRVPALGGVIDIVYGERPTSCPSTVAAYSENKIFCQDQCSLNKNEIMQKALQALSDGIKAGAKDAKLIAWYYMPYPSPLASWCSKFAQYTPDDVIAQFNFESGGEKIQLGKKHFAGDYWVSYEGPAERYAEAARNRKGSLMGAKLQLGCGHELTTVPYIPVPEIAYNKYKEMHSLGVQSVMQSWYIGNFPGLMERACGRLAFHDFSDNKNDFLYSLAAPLWGKKYAANVMEAWEFFTKSYRKFPFSLMFQYYAPQNSFMMWKYHFLPDLDPLAPPWKPNFAFGGDAIGEALAGFTLEDAAILVDEMSSEWQKGMENLLPLKEIFRESREHLLDINNAEMIGLLLQGTDLLLKFFLLRRRLYTEKLSRNEYIILIEEMQDLLQQNKELCKKCIPLLSFDSRLGYHGEALCRIFDEEKTLKALLLCDESMKESNELLAAVKAGVTPLQYAEKNILDVCKENQQMHCGNISWKWWQENDRFMLLLSGFDANEDFWGKAYFTDMTGTRFALQDVFNIENGKCVRKGNMSLIITGEEFDSSFDMQYDGASLLLSWPLASLPGAVEEKMLRFNFQFCSQKYRFLAKGETAPGRLYLGPLKANDTFALFL